MKTIQSNHQHQSVLILFTVIRFLKMWKKVEPHQSCCLKLDRVEINHTNQVESNKTVCLYFGKWSFNRMHHITSFLHDV